MSHKRPWYKRYPDLFIAGTMQLTFEAKCAYSILIDLIYANGGKIADDDLWISRVLGCRTQRWKRLKKELIANGKLEVNSNSLRTHFELEGVRSAKIKDLARDKKIEDISILKDREISSKKSERAASLASPPERLATPRSKQAKHPQSKLTREEARRILAEHNLREEARRKEANDGEQKQTH